MILRSFKAVVLAYLLFLGIGFILSLLIKSIDYFLVVEFYQLPSILETDTLEVVKKYTNNSAVYMFFIVGLLGPLIEEISFRLWLSLKPIHVALSVSLIVNFLLFGLRDLFKFNSKTWILVLCIVLLFYIIYHLLKKVPLSDIVLKYISVKSLGIISAIIFGLLHIFNFSPVYKSVWFLYPIYVLPQMVLGILAVFLRLRYGFVSAVFFHCLVNLLSILVAMS